MCFVTSTRWTTSPFRLTLTPEPPFRNIPLGDTAMVATPRAETAAPHSVYTLRTPSHAVSWILHSHTTPEASELPVLVQSCTTAEPWSWIGRHESPHPRGFSWCGRPQFHTLAGAPPRDIDRRSAGYAPSSAPRRSSTWPH
jgi:hypothetical protein